jgi:phospholipase/carboxylesterase
MWLRRFAPFALISSGLCALVLACTDRPATPVTESKAPLAAAPRAERLDFVERTTGHANAEQPLPMLVVLHGLGDTPENFLDVFSELSTRARLIAVRAPDPWSVGTSWYPIDGSPAEKSHAIAQRAQAVAELARARTDARPTLGKPVVTGFSQGGVLSFALAAYHADRFFAAVPIAGAMPGDLPDPQSPPPWFSVLAFHGESDRRIPFLDGKAALHRLHAAGFRATMTSFPGVGHGIPGAMHEQIIRALDELLDRTARGE